MRNFFQQHFRLRPRLSRSSSCGMDDEYVPAITICIDRAHLLSPPSSHFLRHVLLWVVCTIVSTNATAGAYEGSYKLYAHSPYVIHITEGEVLRMHSTYDGRNRQLQKSSVPIVLDRLSPTEFSYWNTRVEFQRHARGVYESLSLTPNRSAVQPKEACAQAAHAGEPSRTLYRAEILADEYLHPRPQKAYTEQLLREMRPGGYTFSRFISPARGPVDFAVYLPPGWRDGATGYPLLIFLHGQEDSEHGFPFAVPAAQLNCWILQGSIVPFVLFSLRAGRIGGVEEQWSTQRNEALLTSPQRDELRAFIQRHFKAGQSPRTTSIHGHSRGARGALHFALKYPEGFASAVSNALVSDYALKEEALSARANAARVNASGIRYRLSIGAADPFVAELNSGAHWQMHELLTELRIEHEHEILAKATHDFREIWNHGQTGADPNGLRELRFHARAWSRVDDALDN